ncbi:unnamed protein product, partial [Symbiodinium sp. CCMP2456]
NDLGSSSSSYVVCRVKTSSTSTTVASGGFWQLLTVIFIFACAAGPLRVLACGGAARDHLFGHLFDHLFDDGWVPRLHGELPRPLLHRLLRLRPLLHRLLRL